MAKQLSPTEEKTIDALERDMDARVLTYKKEKMQQLKDCKKQELLAELEGLDRYLLGCRNSEIADTLTHIEFVQRKADVLRALLGA